MSGCHVDVSWRLWGQEDNTTRKIRCVGGALYAAAIVSIQPNFSLPQLHPRDIIHLISAAKLAPPTSWASLLIMCTQKNGSSREQQNTKYYQIVVWQTSMMKTLSHARHQGVYRCDSWEDGYNPPSLNSEINLPSLPLFCCWLDRCSLVPKSPFLVFLHACFRLGTLCWPNLERN